MGDCWITLVSSDFPPLEDLAFRRRRWGERTGAVSKNGGTSRLANDRLGVFGEFAAKCYFDPVEWTQGGDGPAIGKPDLDDFIDVRTRRKERGEDLCVLADNSAEFAYVLAAPCQFMGAPTYRIGGWCWGREAKVEKYWRQNSRPAYYVPRDDLAAMHDLSELLAELRHRQAARGGFARQFRIVGA